MDEYRLAFEFWGAVVSLALIAPFFAALARQTCGLFREDEHDQPRSQPLASVPSSPTP